MEREHRGQPRPRATRARSSTRTTTTSRRSRSASSSTSRSRSCKNDIAGPDPLLRRPARRRQDLARPVDRARARAASSCASRSAACATRPRSAGTAAPTSARCRAASSRRCSDAGVEEPGLHARRDRQDRAPTSAATRRAALLEVLDPEQNSHFRDHYLDLPFDLSQGDVHPHREPARTRSPARSCDRMEVIAPVRLHRGREARDRAPVPRAEAARGARPARRRASTITRRARCALIIRELHARGGRAQPRARASPTSAARPRRERRRGQGARRSRSTRARATLASPRPARFSVERAQAHRRPGRGDRPRLDAGRRRRAVRRGDAHARARAG